MGLIATKFLCLGVCLGFSISVISLGSVCIDMVWNASGCVDVIIGVLGFGALVCLALGLILVIIGV